MDTLAKLAIQGGAFLTAAVVLAYLAKWFVIPPLKLWGNSLVQAIQGNTDAVKESIDEQRKTREEVVVMRAEMAARRPPQEVPAKLRAVETKET